MNKRFLLPLFAAAAVSLLFSGCYSQYQTSASRPGDHVGHGSFSGLGPAGHHGELHGSHYFHDDRWGDDHLDFPRPPSPRNAPNPGQNMGY
jgi:hypothetical protein